jgi:hypothetical protein
MHTCEKSACYSVLCRISTPAETWPSGRRRSPAKGVGPEGSRGFESLRLRHLWHLSYCFNYINLKADPHDIPHNNMACHGIHRKSQSPNVAAGASIRRVIREGLDAIPARDRRQPLPKAKAGLVCPTRRPVRHQRGLRNRLAGRCLPVGYRATVLSLRGKL